MTGSIDKLFSLCYNAVTLTEQEHYMKQVVKVEYVELDGRLGCGCCSMPAGEMTVTFNDGTVATYEELSGLYSVDDVKEYLKLVPVAEDCDFSECTF
jgi:succinyl-CoA synthetase beta subunit